MNEFVIRNGFDSRGSGVITGSLTIAGSAGQTVFNTNVDVLDLSGSLSVTGSSGFLGNVRVSGSAQFGPTQNLSIFHVTDGTVVNTSGQLILQQDTVNQRLEIQTSGTLAAGMFRVRNRPGAGGVARDLLEVRNNGTIMIGSSSTGASFLGSTTVMNDLFLASGIIAVNTDTTSIQLVSSGNVTVKLDANNNAPGHYFAVVDNAGNNEFLVNENGNVDVSGNFVVTGSVFSTATTTTFNLLNTTLTGTLNIGGAAQTINFGSPTNTGSMQGDFTVGNRATLGGIVERMNHTQGGATLTCNTILQSIFYHNSPSGPVTANFTGVPITTNRILTPTIIISQSATPQIVSTVQIDSAGQTINWANGVTPTGNANKQDVFGFSLIRSGSGAGTVWKVLGQMSTYG